MLKIFFGILLFIILYKKINEIIDGRNEYKINKKSYIIKLYGEDYRHYSRGKKAFVVNKWTFKNFNKKSMDLLKQRLIKNIPIYKKYHKYKNCIQILNEKSDQCFLDSPVNSCEEMIKIAQKSDIQVLFSLNYEKGEFIISYNHGVIDGLSMTQILQKVVNKECEPYEIKNLDLTIKTFLYSLTKVHITNNCIPIIKDLKKPITIEFKLDANKLKKIMDKTNCTFNAAYAYYILKLINLDNVGVGTLTTGIKKKKSFNSYGIIPFIYSKEDTLSRPLLERR